jgi:hypothetical protein
MNRASLRHVRMEGLAAAAPATIVHNKDCALIPEKERDLYIRSTGIASRRVASVGTCTSDLCVHAAQNLMTALGWKAEEVRIIVFVTQTPDHITPSSAIIIQERLGCTTDCAAFDVNLGLFGLCLWPVDRGIAAARHARWRKGPAPCRRHQHSVHIAFGQEHRAAVLRCWLGHRTGKR